MKYGRPWTEFVWNSFDCLLQYTVKPVYKGHQREPENVVFMSSCTLYTG